jgi:hypothetical protein
MIYILKIQELKGIQKWRELRNNTSRINKKKVGITERPAAYHFYLRHGIVKWYLGDATSAR